MGDVEMSKDDELLRGKMEEQLQSLTEIAREADDEEFSEFVTEDCLDHQFILTIDGKFSGYILTVALGGPNIILKNNYWNPNATLKGGWGTSREEMTVPEDVSNRFFDEMENLAQLAIMSSQRI